jgi:hypothetical protein
MLRIQRLLEIMDSLDVRRRSGAQETIWAGSCGMSRAITELQVEDQVVLYLRQNGFEVTLSTPKQLGKAKAAHDATEAPRACKAR